MQGRSFEVMDAAVSAAETDADVMQLKQLADELIDAARRYLEAQDIDHALKCCQRALGICSAQHDAKGTAIARSTMGIVYAYVGDHAQSLEHQTYALDAAVMSADRERIAATTHNIAMLYEDIGDLPRALEYFQQALEINEERGDIFWQGHNVNGMAMAYQHSGDHEKSLQLFEQALALYRTTENARAIALTLTNVGVTLMQMQRPDEAMPLYSEALAIEREHDMHALEVHTLIAVGGAQVLQQRLHDARTTFDLVRDAPIEAPRIRVMRDSLAANISVMEGQPERALEHFLRGLEDAENHNLPAYIAEMHKELRDLARSRGDLDAYVRHNDAYISTKEITQGRETTTRLAMMSKQREIDSIVRERERERAVLFAALPRNVADRILRGERITGDEYDHAAVLFLDVAAFTRHSATMHPTDVVTLLEDLFRSLDGSCERHGVTKIKTMGDSYMCFRGDAEPTENARSVAAVALEACMLQQTWPSGDPVLLRVGAHVGPVTAGVIGTERLQYDVWGDTVNVASRMESTGEPGRIHVSEAFARRLDAAPQPPVAITLIPRGMVEVKGKGAMQTYWLGRA